MKWKRRIVILALLVLALVACAGRDAALDAQEADTAGLVEVVADHEYVLVVLRVEHVAQVSNAIAVAGLSDGDQVEVWRVADSVPEIVWP